MSLVLNWIVGTRTSEKDSIMQIRLVVDNQSCIIDSSSFTFNVFMDLLFIESIIWFWQLWLNCWDFRICFQPFLLNFSPVGVFLPLKTKVKFYCAVTKKASHGVQRVFLSSSVGVKSNSFKVHVLAVWLKLLYESEAIIVLYL